MSVGVALHPCARCARVQATCCQRAEIVLTLGDVERIAASTKRVDFHEHRAPSNPDYTAEDPQDPGWRRYTLRADGTRRMLKRERNGGCVFLGAAGCTLALACRPLVCRLYPHDYTESGVDGIDQEYCPTALLAPQGQPMTEVLGVRREDAVAWHRMLYEELRRGTP